MQHVHQPVHPCSLISIIVVECLENIVPILTLKVPRKMHMKMLTAEVICCK